MLKNKLRIHRTASFSVIGYIAKNTLVTGFGNLGVEKKKRNFPIFSSYELANILIKFNKKYFFFFWEVLGQWPPWYLWLGKNISERIIENVTFLALGELSSTEGFSAILQYEISLNIKKDEVKRIEGWGAVNYPYFQRSNGFQEEVGMYTIQESGYYFVSLNINVVKIKPT